MLLCPGCGGDVFEHTDAQVVCVGCGNVLEDSLIVADVQFAETSAGGAVVQGSYVGNEQRGARTLGPGGYRSGGEGVSRENTIQNARSLIRRIGNGRRVPPSTIDKAGRLFVLALEGGTYRQDGNEPLNYVLGRKSIYTATSCLYVACRMDQTNHMLIDFADAIGVNVFILGRSYLRLVRCLGFKMPVIDPSIYIARFAALLDFGEETQRVASDAARLVQRFKKDWITHGRRPAGICGACLLLAARMNNFRRSIAEIIQVVKIADVTLRRRLEEFKKTPSAELSVDQFRGLWLETEEEPPAFALARLPKKEPKQEASGRAAKRNRLSGEDEDEDGNEADGEEDDEEAEGPHEAIDPRLEAMAEQATREEIERYLEEDAAHEVERDTEATIQAKRSSTVQPEDGAPVDDLGDLDEEELDAFILNEEEVRIKERVWIEFNRDYLEKTLERQLKMEADIKAGVAPKPTVRRKRNKPRDSSNAPATAAESTQELLKKKPFSRRLNYDAIKVLFDDPAATAASSSSANDKGVKRQKRTYSDAEEEEEVEGAITQQLASRFGPRARSSYISDADTTDAEALTVEEGDEEEIIEEDGRALPKNHPSVRKRSKADQLQRAQRLKRTSAALSDQAEDPFNRGLTTDAETENEDEAWTGLPGLRAAEQSDTYDDDPYGDNEPIDDA